MVEYTAVYIVTTGGNTSIQLMIVHYHMFTIITIYGYIKAIIHDYLCKHCLLATNYFLSITLSVLVHNVPAEVDLARPVYSAHLLLLLLMVAHDCHWCCHSECVVVTIAPPTSIQYHMYQQRLQFWLYHTPSQS